MVYTVLLNKLKRDREILNMLATVFVLFSIVLRLLSGAKYLAETIKGRIQPSPVSWFFWGLTPLVAFAVQAQQGISPQAFATLAIGAGPLVVFIVTLLKSKRRFKFTLSDKICACFALLGIVLWAITSNGILAVAFGIIGDIFSSVPTIIKSFNRPHTEHGLPYLISLASMLFALAAVKQWDFTHYGFTLYIMLINMVFVTLIYGRVGARWKKFSQRKKLGEVVAG